MPALLARGSDASESLKCAPRPPPAHSFSDARFTSGIPGVFFPFQKHLSSVISNFFVLKESKGGYLYPEDGSKPLWDADSSFGVNVLGYERCAQPQAVPALCRLPVTFACTWIKTAVHPF